MGELRNSRLLYSSNLSSSSATKNDSSVGDGNTYQQFKLVDEKIAQEVREMMEEMPETIEGTGELGRIIRMHPGKLTLRFHRHSSGQSRRSIGEDVMS